MPQQFEDNARALLTGTITSSATSLSVESAKADRFPVGNTSNWTTPLNWFKATLIDPSTGAREVIKVGTRAAGNGAMSNVLRGQDGTTAQSWTAGAVVVHGPLAADFRTALAGIFPYMAAIDGGDPKLEVAKTGTGAAAALFHMTSGKLTLAQSDGTGTVTADRFTFDQTNGNFTATGVLSGTDLALTSDERLKSGWRALPRHFIARLADVKHGIYRKKGRKTLEVGVSAQSLKEVLPQAVSAGADGMLAVSYQNAALVAAIALAQDNRELRAELADLTERVRLLERRR
jgi:hypothetical protein